ncbi:hypothetical protein NIES4103_00300 [Nostoc sp. NIES-4103]|nr:hypothetical protein NIES4103_00300 [Nostoc sp. NIES-4103]
MIFEWFTTWVATKAVGFLVKTIISEDFLKDLVKDYAKDFFKYIFNNAVTAPFKREPLDKAVVMALTEFLQLMQDDLEYVGLSEDDIKKYTQPIKQFLKHQEVKVILGNAFKHDCQTIDTKKLQAIWYQLNSSSALSDDFNWQVIGKKYLKKVQDIIREVPELRDILDSWNLEKIKQNTTEIAGIIPQFDLERYQEGIRERYGKLKLESLDTTGYAYNDLKLWRMFIAQNVRKVHQVLPQVHELPKEHLRRLRETNQLEAEVALEELERQKRVYFEQPIRSVLDVVNDQHYKYVVILGDPGSGKSTLLQYLALNWAESPLNNSISLPIPVLIELRTYMRRWCNNECQNFLEFHHQCSGVIAHLNQHQLHEQLKAGNALVMFDGLDEVFDPGLREDVITDIHRFTNDYPNVQVIVTSRVIGYKPQRLLDAGFRHFMLQDLDSEQIQDFICRWHELTFSDEADKLRKRERLKRGIANSKAITELAGNPLLLTMMAILNRNQELPRDRAELYNQASRVLLHQWDVERALVEDKRLDPKTIDYKDKQAMLRQVAYFMQTGEKGLAGNLISAGNLEKILTDYLKTIEYDKPREAGRVMINQLRTRNFMLCFVGADYYAFVHRTFLEYFCAWEFVWQFKESQTLSIEGLKQDVFGQHWQDETWHEVLRLIMNMIEPKFAGQIIDYLIEISDYLINEIGDEKEYTDLLFLASECISDVRNRSVIASTDNRLLKYLKSLTQYYAPYSPEDVIYASTDQATLIQNIRTKAVSVVTTIWRNHVETLPWLKTLAKSGFNGDDGNTQAKAVRELVQGWKDDPDTLPILKSLAQSIDHRDNISAYAAIQELAQGWKDDPQTLPMLKSLAQSSNDSSLQNMAVRELVRGWKDDPDTLPMLKSLAQSSNDMSIKFTVVEELAQGWKNNLDILSVLKKSVQLDSFGYVRHKVMEELIQGWHANFEIYNFLCECAADDSFNPAFFDFSTDNNSDPHNIPSRQIALEAIIKQFPQHSQTLPLLRDRAENDPDEQVREYAQNQLKQWEGLLS